MGVTFHVQFSKMTSFVVVLILLQVVVAVQPTLNFSMICAQMLTFTLSIMQLAYSLALVASTIRLCFALDP